MGAPKATDMPAAEAAERISRFFASKSGTRMGISGERKMGEEIGRGMVGARSTKRDS